MIYLLVICLLIITIIAYVVNNKELTAPSFVFSLSFLFSSIWALAFKQEWLLDSLHLNTFLVIVGGNILFLIVSRFISIFFKKNDKTNMKDVEVDSFIKIICIIYMILVIILSIRSLLNATGYSWGNILGAVKYYDSVNKFGSEYIGLSKTVFQLRYLSFAFTYWYMYLFDYKILMKKKVDFSYLIIILLGLLSTLVTGARMIGVCMIFAGIGMYLLLLILNKNNGFKISKKAIFRIIAIPVILLFLFPKLTYMVGRNVNTTNTYYLAIYCGAEIKNLDLYLQEYGNSVKTDKHNMTFKNLVDWLGPKLGYKDTYKFDQPFRSINGNTLGNVYTTFYSYIYDYGYMGMIVLVSIMSFICQFVYEKCKSLKELSKPSIWILIYGYIFGTLVLVFYTNRFYEQVFSATFFYSILLWIIYNNVFLRFKHKK